MQRYRDAAAPSHLRGSFLSFRFSEKDDKRKAGQKRPRMHLFELTRALVDIESTTNHEKNVTDYLFARLSELAGKSNGQIQRISAEPGRDNLFASWGEPVVTLSTHMDTVPPYFASGEDEQFIFGRGACDAKGIIAAMVTATERLLAAGTRNFGLLLVVGEERNSAGAKAASALRQAVASAVAGRAEASEVLYTPAIRLNKLDGLPTTVVAFTTDIPTFRGAWGEPFLIGPGSIHVAHTAEERVAKKELCDAVEIYTRMTTQLLTTGRSAA